MSVLGFDVELGALERVRLARHQTLERAGEAGAERIGALTDDRRRLVPPAAQRANALEQLGCRRRRRGLAVAFGARRRPRQRLELDDERFAIGVFRFELDLVGTHSLEAVKEKVAEAVKSAEPNEWIRGRGWDQNDWEGFDVKKQKFPSAADLDRIAPDHPVVLTRIDGHAIWVNSKAMAIAGVDAKTKQVPGGKILMVRGKPSDQLPNPGRELAAVARAAGWTGDDPGEYLDHYLKVTRRARRVVEEVFGT